MLTEASTRRRAVALGRPTDVPAGAIWASESFTINGTYRSACVVNGRLRQEGEGAFRPAPPYQRARPRTALPGRAAPAAATLSTGDRIPRDREGQPGHPAAGPDLLCRDIRRLIHGCLPRRPQKTNPAPPAPGRSESVAERDRRPEKRDQADPFRFRSNEDMRQSRGGAGRSHTYAPLLGRIPAVLLSRVKEVEISASNNPWEANSSAGIFHIYTGQV